MGVAWETIVWDGKLRFLRNGLGLGKFVVAMLRKGRIVMAMEDGFGGPSVGE